MNNQWTEDFKKKYSQNKTFSNTFDSFYNELNSNNSNSINQKQKLNIRNSTKSNITNKNTNITKNNPLKYIHDEKFITTINDLSFSIKNFFQNNKLYLGNIKLISESINEQVLFARSAINDILLYFNQITNNNKLKDISEKYIKDKIKLIDERVDKINELKLNMGNNIKNSENSFFVFYNEAKLHFKKMKNIHIEKIEKCNKNIYNLNTHHNRTVSHSPSSKIALSKSKKNINNNNANNININKIPSSSINNSLTNSININIGDITDFRTLKMKYIELFKENKKLKQDLVHSINSNINLNNDINSNNIKKKSNIHRCASANKKKYIEKNLTLSNNNSNMKQVKTNSNSRTHNTTQCQNSNTMNSLDEENNKLLYKNISKKSEMIPSGLIEKDNNPLSLSKNSGDYEKCQSMGGSCRNNEKSNSNLGNTLNTLNNFNNSNIYLASMVLSFLIEMKNLQEYITKKVNNIKDLKKNFELKKRELKKHCQNIVENSGMNNLILKSKEQSLKASFDSFEAKDLNSKANNVTNLVKELEIKNKELNNIIQNKEKEITNLNNQLNEKTKKITEFENEIKMKEDKIRTEKEISNLKDEKLNSEKLKNKELTEMKNNYLIELQKAKNTITNLENLNNKLDEIQSQQKKKIDDLNSKIKIETNKLNSLNKNLDKSKILESDIITIRNENMKLKQQITQCNSSLVSISNTNESIIHEKDKIITNLTNNIKELNKQIDLLNDEISKHGNDLSKSTILTDEIIKLRKNNEESQQKIMDLQKENRQLKNKMSEIKTSYVSRDEDFIKIMKNLQNLDKQTEFNLKKIDENEKKFDTCVGKKNIDEGEKEVKDLRSVVKNIDKGIEEYKMMLEEFKTKNEILSKLNIENALNN